MSFRDQVLSATEFRVIVYFLNEASKVTQGLNWEFRVENLEKRFFMFSHWLALSLLIKSLVLPQLSPAVDLLPSLAGRARLGAS